MINSRFFSFVFGNSWKYLLSLLPNLTLVRERVFIDYSLSFPLGVKCQSCTWIVFVAVTFLALARVFKM